MIRNRAPSNTSYHISEVEGSWLLIERTKLNQSGSHNAEDCVGVYRCPEDAEASMAEANERLWAAVTQ